MKLGFIKSTRSRTFTFACDTRKYELTLPLRPNFSPICDKDSVHNTTKQEKEMEIVECNTDEYKDVRQNHGSFYTVKKKKKYKQEGTCIRPWSVGKVTVKHLKTGLCFLRWLTYEQLQFPTLPSVIPIVHVKISMWEGSQ